MFVKRQLWEAALGRAKELGAAGVWGLLILSVALWEVPLVAYVLLASRGRA